MIHPDTELRYKDAAVGHAVYATRFIPRGTIVWTLCELDIRLPPARVAVLALAYRAIIDRYAYGDADGDRILCWDHGRYVNHACDPAMVGAGPEVEIAVRDLRPGDELTCDYGTLNLVQALQCRCGAANCRSMIGADDALRVWPQLDALARAAVGAAGLVPQPLDPFVREPRRLAEWIAGRAPLPSSRAYHHESA